MNYKTLFRISVLLLLIGIAAGSLAGTLPGFMLFFMSMASWYWEQHLTKNIHVTFEVTQKKVSAGEEVHGYFRIANQQPLPVPFLSIVVDWSPGFGMPTGTEVCLSSDSNKFKVAQNFSMRWFEKVSRRFTLRCKKRGEYFLGPMNIKAKDFFGFAESRSIVKHQERILVYPRQVPVNFHNFISKSPFGSRAFRSYLYEDPVLFRGTRDYMTYDPFSKIEWKASARMGRLQTRLLDASFDTEAVLLVDLACSKHFWAINEDLQERTLVAAASVVQRFFLKRIQYGIHVNSQIAGQYDGAYIGKGSGESHYRACLEVLARVTSYCKIPCEVLLSEAGKRMADHAHIWMLTGFLSDPLQKEILIQKQRGRKLTVIYTGEIADLECMPGLPIYGIQEEEGWNDIEQITIYPILR